MSAHKLGSIENSLNTDELENKIDGLAQSGLQIRKLETEIDGIKNKIDVLLEKSKQENNKLEDIKNSLADSIKSCCKSEKISQIITFDNIQRKVILSIKDCGGCKMTLVEFKTNVRVNSGLIHVEVNQVKNSYVNGEEKKYIYSFYHNGGKIRQKPPALIYYPITEKFGSFIEVNVFYDNGQKVTLNEFHLKFHIKN